MTDSHEFRFFDWLDYSVFGILLLASALIGVYFAFFAKKKQNTTSEYLLGGKSMGIFPISMSLIASHISGIALIGMPSEIYVFGTQFWIIVIAEMLTAVIMATMIIPVFYNLEITSTYEYLNKRFNPTARTMGSILFLCKMMLYIPIVIYVPALAFSQVSGFSLEIMIPVVCIVCIFYTSLGGIKAVVWTDTLQMMLMIIGVVTVTVMGTYDVGGISTIWQRNKDGGRIDFFNMSFDPTIRHTFWNILFGKFFQHMSSCTINQAMVQRCLAMPTLREARITIAIYALGIAFLVNMCCYTGLVIFAAFYDCDPVRSGVIGKADQLLPYFVMKVTSHIPALPGIFVSGVFSAALSTMSTGLNSMCGVILEDFIRPLHKTPISEGRASFYMKIITVILGVICVLLAFVVDKLGGLIQTSGSLGGITAGTLLGMFLLGMLFPWANAVGAIVGGVTAALLVGWMCLGSQLAMRRKQLVFPIKSISMDGCENSTLHSNSIFINHNFTSGILDNNGNELVHYMHRVSYIYYTIIGMVTVIVVGLVVSYFTGFNDPTKMDKDLFIPVIQNYVDRKQKQRAKCVHQKNEGKIAPITEKHLVPLLDMSNRRSPPVVVKKINKS